MSINILIPVQTLICSSSFIKISMPIISIAVLICFKDQPWEPEKI